MQLLIVPYDLWYWQHWAYMKNAIEYNLAELAISLDPSHPRHLNPPVPPPHHKILDLGCGAGQILKAIRPEAVSFGCDIDMASMQFGRTLSNNVRFTCCRAEALPYASSTFDMVIARASLPYTDLTRSLGEVRRVLKPEGTVWMTLHSWAKQWQLMKEEDLRGKLLMGCSLVNGMLFHTARKLINFPRKGYASFQTDSSITRALESAGFTAIRIQRGAHYLVTARAA